MTIEAEKYRRQRRIFLIPSFLNIQTDSRDITSIRQKQDAMVWGGEVGGSI